MCVCVCVCVCVKEREREERERGERERVIKCLREKGRRERETRGLVTCVMFNSDPIKYEFGKPLSRSTESIYV